MLTAERHGAVLLITLNRPDKRNALHPALLAELAHVLEHTAGDPELNVVVVTGAGQAFCAGLDLHYLLSQSYEGKTAYLEQVFALFQKIYTLPQPVIAAVNGPALAGGFDLAVMCDLRLCSPAATFAQTEVLLGLTQMLYPLYQIIGLGAAKELALTGEAITAEEAHRIGLVNRIYPAEELLEQALSRAERLAARPREALFETKRLSLELIDLDTKLAFERMKATIIERLASAEHQLRVEEFVKKLKK